MVNVDPLFRPALTTTHDRRRRWALGGSVLAGLVLGLVITTTIDSRKRILDFWNIRADEARFQQIHPGMAEARVLAILGPPTVSEGAPFKESGIPESVAMPPGTAKRLVYQRDDRPSLVLCLDGAGVVLSIERPLIFNPIELWSGLGQSTRLWGAVQV